MKLLIALLVVGSTCGAPQPGYYGNQFDLFNSNEYSSEEFGFHKEANLLPQFESQGQHYEDRDFISSFYPNQNDAFQNNYQPPKDFQFPQSYSVQHFPHVIKDNNVNFPYFVPPKFSGFILSQNGTLIPNMSSPPAPKMETMTTANPMNAIMNMTAVSMPPTKMPPMNATVAPAQVNASTVKPAAPTNINNGPLLFFRKFLSLFVGGVPTDPVAIQPVNFTKRIFK